MALALHAGTVQVRSPRRHQPPNEPMPAWVKQMGIEMKEYWGNGRARLWNPHFDFLPVVVRKMNKREHEAWSL